MDVEPGQSGMVSDAVQCPHCGVLHQADGSVSRAIRDRDGRLYAAVKPLRLLNSIDTHVAQSTNDGSNAVIEPSSGRVLATGATAQKAADSAEAMARQLGRRRLQKALNEDGPIQGAATVRLAVPDYTPYPESWDVRSPEYRAAAGKAFVDKEYALARPDDAWAAVKARTELRANPPDYLAPGVGQEMRAWDKGGEDDAGLRAQNDLAMPLLGIFSGPMVAARAADANERQVEDAGEIGVAELGLAGGMAEPLVEGTIASRSLLRPVRGAAIQAEEATGSAYGKAKYPWAVPDVVSASTKMPSRPGSRSGRGVTNPEIKKLPFPSVPPGMTRAQFGRDLIKWGRGPGDALRRADSVTAADIAEMQKRGLTKKMCEESRDFYANDFTRNSNNDTAANRVKLMGRILSLWQE